MEAIRRALKGQHEVEVVTALLNYPTGKILPGYGKRWFVDERQDDIPLRRS